MKRGKRAGKKIVIQKPKRKKQKAKGKKKKQN